MKTFGTPVPSRFYWDVPGGKLNPPRSCFAVAIGPVSASHDAARSDRFNDEDGVVPEAVGVLAVDAIKAGGGQP